MLNQTRHAQHQLQFQLKGNIDKEFSTTKYSVNEKSAQRDASTAHCV